MSRQKERRRRGIHIIIKGTACWSREMTGRKRNGVGGGAGLHWSSGRAAAYAETEKGRAERERRGEKAGGKGGGKSGGKRRGETGGKAGERADGNSLRLC